MHSIAHYICCNMHFIYYNIYHIICNMHYIRYDIHCIICTNIILDVTCKSLFLNEKTMKYKKLPQLFGQRHKVAIYFLDKNKKCAHLLQ